MQGRETIDAQLAALASHLEARREKILETWRQAAACDAELVGASGLSRTQLNDHIPDVLDAFGRKLSAQVPADEMKAATEQKEAAGGHGIHRWHHGYNQRAVMREWGHLHLCLIEELENYACAHPELDAVVMRTARRALAELLNEGVLESAARYTELQQVEAASRVRDLEHALFQAKSLEHHRAEILRDATHDLRGKVGVVHTAAAALSYDAVSERDRIELVKMLQQGMESLRSLLNDLMSLARLEAGQEQRKLKTIDGAKLLRDLCDNFRALAADRGLFLKTEGPDTLPIEGDPVMIYRIGQNLLLNALKYTERGGVKVTWRADEASLRWRLCVQDTGPGFQGGPVTPLAHALKEATDQALDVEEKAEASEQASIEPPPSSLASQSSVRPSDLSGEGIGLSIVKRLCEILDATLELETERGKGSTFRIVFPRNYENSL